MLSRMDNLSHVTKLAERKDMSPDGGGPDVDPRVLLAAERTLLAWIRTGVALMGFGFVVARFGLFLRELAAANGYTVTARINASTIGVAIVAAGLFVNLWASIRYRRMVGGLMRGEPFDARSWGPVAVGVATAVGGAVLVSVLLAAVLR
jgi:putative membrane protein